MAERAIEEGFVDCPKYGIMDELRCLPSCEFHDSKEETHVTCTFGEEPPAGAADDSDAEPQAEQPEAAPA